MVVFFFFFKQKTAYELRISDWSSDVCSSDLLALGAFRNVGADAECLFAGRGQDRAPDVRLRVDPLPCRVQQLVHLTRDRVHSAFAVQANVGDLAHDLEFDEIGRASVRERGCQYVELSVVAVPLKKKQPTK